VKQDIIINEIQIMKDSHHHAIVNYIDSYIVEGTLWVVMELINGGSLAELIEVGSLLPFLCVRAAALAHRGFLVLARCARR
jgi:serine/threonine protein kinase